MNFIFDVDNTLYRQEDIFIDALKNQFKISEKKLRKIFYRSRYYSDEVSPKVKKGYISLEQLHIYRLKKSFSDFGIDITTEKAIFLQQLYAKEQENIRLSKEAKMLLRYLTRNGYKLGVITNGPGEHQWKKIERMNLKKWIPRKNIIVSGDTPFEKPDKNIFQILGTQLQLSSSNTYYIGDSYRTDIVGAKNIGWNAIWINHTDKRISNSLEDLEIKKYSKLYKKTKKFIKIINNKQN